MDTRRYHTSRRLDRETPVDERAGFALEATMMIMLLLSGLILVLMQTATTAFRTGFLDYTNSRAFYAAEAGAEAAMGQVAIRMEDGVLDDQDISELAPPDLEGFSFDSFSVQKIGAVDVETITDGPFAGLYSLTQMIEVYSEAREPAGSSNAVLVSAKAQAIPIFQFGVFFEKDLEATNGPPLEFAGWVHSNGNIYLSSENAWYRDQITTPNKFVWDRKDFHEKDNGVYINDAMGNEVLVDFDSRSHPVAADFRAESEAKFDSRVKTDAHGVDSLKVPLPPGMDPIEVLLPKEDTDTEMEKRAKMAWKADMHVEVDLANLSTAGSVCGDQVPYAEPDNVSANDINVTADGGICPGRTVTFTFSHAALTCAEFDNRATIQEISWGGTKLVENQPMDGCQVVVTVPSGTVYDFVVKVELKKENYAQLAEDQHLDMKWTKEWISENCGDGEGGGGNKYGAKGDDTPYPPITITRTGGLEVPDNPELCKIFFFDWAAFYDGREQSYTDVMNVDIVQLSNWVGTNASRKSEVIYVEFIVPTTVDPDVTTEILDYSYDPAVRMRSGTTLPNPLSVATHYPMYVQGDYNAVDWKPAAVMGDAITFLSNAWLDSEHMSGWSFDAGEIKGYTTQASDTEYWMAVLAGHSATPCDHEDTGCAGGYQDFYGGGIENYLRFLEKWTKSVTALYRGSLVSLHISETVDGTWNGNYYSPPARDWAFDMRFEDWANLPPGTPTVGNVIHTAFRPVY